MTIAQAPTQTYTADEYLEREVVSDIRSEFRNGEIIERTGGTPAHNKIASALNALLWFGLRGKPFNVFVTDQRFWIPGPDLYTSPDVVVISEPLTLKEGRMDSLIRFWWQRCYQNQRRIMIGMKSLRLIAQFPRFGRIYWLISIGLG